ncbi:MAG: UDP-glucuronate 4-epimerase [Rhodospirillaceae bacterium]|nr:MAG: UDP-glucuronate 4-epimerase [Rhodospirillaceae bacterium]
MTILVTGAAGFIGYHTCMALLARGEQVIGVDNVNDYYDPALKQARLARISAKPGFHFHSLDIAEREGMLALRDRYPDMDRVIHLAAQAGVRYSLVNPFAYSRANLEGQLVILELCRSLRTCRHLVYASSSSVYGANRTLPFAVEDRVDNPISLYAATKKAGELMGHCYSHLYRIPTTGLRFFTVYGPWGRPDMALYIFSKRILAGEPIPVFNNGAMKRDFTYIDDIIAGVIGCLDHPPEDDGFSVPQRLYNIGNNRPEPLLRCIALLEQALGRQATINFQPMQPGDVSETYADITAITRDIGYAPTTSIDVGVPKFVAWYRDYHGMESL